MTKKRQAKPDMKLVTGAHGALYDVPKDASIGKNFSIHIENTLNVGASCIIGDNVYIGYLNSAGNNFVVGNGAEVGCREVGNDVYIGAGSKVSGGAIGHNVTIGKNCTIYCNLPDDIVIGDNVTLGRETAVQPGIKFPDNWYIPEGGYIVNPGLDGYPVAFAPIPPRLHCDITVANRSSDDYYR